ncbi:hypothetical protein L7F22_060355 [Adiantum nelumboides]|nr:hypothetical protein [Adiantum nelumboides]
MEKAKIDALWTSVVYPSTIRYHDILKLFVNDDMYSNAPPRADWFRSRWTEIERVLMVQDTQPQDDSESFDLDDGDGMHLDRLHTILLQLLTQLGQGRATVTSKLGKAINSVLDAVQTYQIDVADVQVCKLEEQVFLLGRHLASIKTKLKKLSGLIIRLSNGLDRAQM